MKSGVRGRWITAAVLLGLAGWYVWASVDWTTYDLSSERAIAEQMAEVDAATEVSIDERRPPRFNFYPIDICCDNGAVVVTYAGDDVDELVDAVEQRMRAQGWEPGVSGWEGPTVPYPYVGLLTRDDEAGEVRLSIGLMEG